MIALAMWILEKSGSPSLMGLLLLASALPGFLTGPFAGAFVDIRSKKNIVVVMDMLRGALICLSAVLEYFDKLEIWQIIAVSVLISLMTAFFDPAIRSLVPEVVDEEDLPNANALNEFVNGISTVVGPMLGAGFIGVIGFVGTFMINGLSFIISAFFEMFIHTEKITHEGIKGDKSNLWIDVKEGFRYLLMQKQLLKVIIIIGVVHFAVGSFILLLPFLSEAISENSSFNLGLLQGFFGVGMIIGSSVFNIKRLKRKKMNLLVIMLMILGSLYAFVGFFNMGNISMLTGYLILTSLMGIVIANAASFWQLILQLNTSENMRGKIFGIASMMGNISMPIAFFSVGLILESIALSVYLVFLGFVLLFLSLVWYKGFSEELKPMSKVL